MQRRNISEVITLGEQVWLLQFCFSTTFVCSGCSYCGSSPFLSKYSSQGNAKSIAREEWNFLKDEGKKEHYSCHIHNNGLEWRRKAQLLSKEELVHLNGGTVALSKE